MLRLSKIYFDREWQGKFLLNMTIFKDNTIDMYTNTIKKTISVFAKDIIDTHTLTLIFKSNVFSKEQRTFNITKYSHSTISENEFWDIFQSSNIHEHFTTNVPNIINHYGSSSTEEGTS